MWDRLFALTAEDEVHARADLIAFRHFALLYAATRSWLWLLLGQGREPAGTALTAAVLTFCLALSFAPRAAHLATRVALGALWVQLVAVFPLGDNHFFLELSCMTLLCVVSDRDPEGEALAFQGLRWLVVIALFQTGLQKLGYGHYFRAEFLAFMVGVEDRFADVFTWILPADEVARLRGYDPLRDGAGPYRVDSLPLVLMSNAIWLAEMALPGLLVWRRTRTAAWVAALVLVLGIQLGAREVGFALLFAILLLLFAPVPLVRRLLLPVALFCAWAIGAAMGILPGGSWLDPGSL